MIGGQLQDVCKWNIIQDDCKIIVVVVLQQVFEGLLVEYSNEYALAIMSKVILLDAIAALYMTMSVRMTVCLYVRMFKVQSSMQWVQKFCDM